MRLYEWWGSWPTLIAKLILLELQDESSGTNIKVDIDHVDQLESVASPILSLGKLLRLEYDFHLSEHGANCFMLTYAGRGIQSSR